MLINNIDRFMGSLNAYCYDEKKTFSDRLKASTTALTTRKIIIITSESVDGGRVLHGRHEWFEVKEGRGRGSAKRAEFVLVVQPVAAHGGQLPSFGHEHDQQDERGRGAQAQRQAAVLVAGLRGPQARHGPAHAKWRRAAHGQADVHGLAVVVAYVPRLDGQHGDGQQQRGRVHQRT